jgi:hypothetical protein
MSLFGHNINAFRAQFIRSLVMSGYPLDYAGLDEPERAYADEMAALRRAGVVLNSPDLQTQAEQVLSILPPRLRSWLESHRSPAEIIGFAEPEATEAEVIEKFTSTGGEGKARTEGRRRDGAGRLIAKPKSQRGPVQIGKKRRSYILDAHRAIKQYGGNVPRAAGSLNIPPGTLRRRLRWTPPEDIAAEVERIGSEPIKPTPKRKWQPSSVVPAPTSAPDLGNLTKLRALAEQIKQQLKQQ